MPDPNTVAQITAGGSTLTNVESLIVRRDFHNGVSVFSFTPTEATLKAVKLQPGDPVTVSLGGHQVINGFVTTRSVAYDADTHQVVIAGKSLTADVHDSSVPIQSGSFDGQTFEQIARSVLAPHKVGLVMRNPSSTASMPFNHMRAQYGETGGELIGRLAAMRGMFVSDDENGNLVVGQGNPGAAVVAELYEGRNIKRVSARLDDQTAFSKYSGVSQSASSTADQPPRYFSSSLQNPNIRSNREKTFIAEHPAESSSELQPAVTLEANKSHWDLVNVSVTVVGWVKPDGSLWEPTDNVSIYSPMIFPNATASTPLGIQSCTYAQDSQNGTTTTLDCVLPWLLTSSPSYGLSDAGSGGSGTGSGEIDKSVASPTPQGAQPDTPDFSGGVDI